DRPYRPAPTGANRNHTAGVTPVSSVERREIDISFRSERESACEQGIDEVNTARCPFNMRLGHSGRGTWTTALDRFGE
ncbi:MAG: hypothetical protein AB7V43_08915, partial [Acidimicrobiia bacterium]